MVQQDQGGIRCSGIKKAGTCPEGRIPALDPENAEAAAVYLACRGQVVEHHQVIGGERRIIQDLSTPAVEATMRIMRVPARRRMEVLYRVRDLWFEMRGKE